MPSPRRVPALAAVVLVLLVSACGPQEPRPRTPEEVRAQIERRLLPSYVTDRAGWALDVQTAFAALEIEPSDVNLCAALAVTEQESSFVADPEVPNLAAIAREEIVRRAARMHVPAFAVRAALQMESPDGRTYDERLKRVRTERQLSDLYEEMIAQVPLGKGLLGRANPVHTGGPMQVSIDFAKQHARHWPYPYGEDLDIRHEVFTRRGGMYFGIAHLLGYSASYEQPLHRFADFNAGFYASRNAAFQQAVNRVAGTQLALDGDLVVPKRGAVGATERAVLSLAPQLQLSGRQIRNALEKGHRHDFEETALYARLFALADTEAGLRVPRAVLPRIDLESPKITRKLTTEWFALRVQKRFEQCVARGKG